MTDTSSPSDAPAVRGALDWKTRVAIRIGGVLLRVLAAIGDALAAAGRSVDLAAALGAARAAHGPAAP